MEIDKAMHDISFVSDLVLLESISNLIIKDFFFQVLFVMFN